VRELEVATITIEYLERRRLLAQTIGQLVTEITRDVASIKATVTASNKISATDQHALAAKLHPASAANATLLKALKKDFGASLANTRSDATLASLIGLTDVKKAEAAVQTAAKHKFSTATLASANKALAKLSKDDNAFVSTSFVNAFYSLTAVPQTDEAAIGSANPQNASLTAALPALEARANFSNTLFPEFNSLVQDVSAYATAITSNFPGTVF
jgi:hypothetical protein